ncbi:MAG: Gfo/Idh/MocA family oxidoreductase [Isosphaeraceae bacterium]|nr:Gfo/Idh/MocA family oxidoreductase [Isosphaeraceae bacterium]
MIELERPLGVLVSGAGFLGTLRAAAAIACPHTRLVGIHEVDRARGEQVAARFGTVAVDAFDRALELPGVDLVVISTPHADHEAAIERALSAGKHVLCEKPLTLESEAGFALTRRADAAGLKLATGFDHRFLPPVRDALVLHHEWAIGRVESVRIEIGHSASPEFLASWHTDVERSGGGTLFDNGPHACDLIRRWIGDVTHAKGYVQTTPALDPRCDVEAFGLFRGRGRAIAELHSSWNLARGYLTIDVRGDDGWIHVETAPWRLAAVVAGGRRITRGYLRERVHARLHRARFGCEPTHVAELADLVARIEGRPHRGATGWDGVHVTEMIEAVYQAARIGEEVTIPDPVVARESNSADRARVASRS